MTWLRSLVFLAVTVIAMLVVGIVASPLLAFDRPRAGRVTRWFSRFEVAVLRMIAGLDLEMRGLDTLPDGPFLFAAKHQSAMETYALTARLPQACFVLKQEILQVPVAGWFVTAMDVIAVDRRGGTSALKSMVTQARAVVAQGRSVVIFPEGTRVAPGELQRYHPGVAALYTGLDIPVVPVALNTGLFWRRRGFLKHPGRAVIAFLDPIPPGLERKAFMAELETRIEGGTRALLDEAGGA